MKYVDIPFLMQYRNTYLPAVGLGLSVAVIGDSEAEIEYMKYEEVYHFYIKKETNFNMPIIYENIFIYQKPRF